MAIMELHSAAVVFSSPILVQDSAAWTRRPRVRVCHGGGRSYHSRAGSKEDSDSVSLRSRRRAAAATTPAGFGKFGSQIFSSGVSSVSWNSNIGAAPAQASRRRSIPPSRAFSPSRSPGPEDGVSATKAVAVESPAPTATVEGDEAQSESSVEYDWRNEWYPLYLTAEIPRDNPLAVNVYDHGLVLFYDGDGQLNCLEDLCPHRLAKLSDGHIMDGNLECLYHGWQFKGNGSCTKIPQLPAGSSIPRSACARSYAIKESQDVVWVWMGDKKTADQIKLPYFENYDREGFQHVSTIHDFPYDHSILVENVLDPAHVQISHDKTDTSARREKAEAISFQVLERTPRGFSASVRPVSAADPSVYRFEAPSIVRNDRVFLDKNGKTQCLSAAFLIRPTGQGKCSIIIRFGGTTFGNSLKIFPKWMVHMLGAKVFEEDINYLAAQNEELIRKKLPTGKLYLNLRSSDMMVLEYRKWLDKVGTGMPYYFGHKSISYSPVAALVERAPAGLEAHAVSALPSKGAFGHMYARDPTNRYFRHVIHCKACKSALTSFRNSQSVSFVLALVSAAVGTVLSQFKWKATFVGLALLLGVVSWVSSKGAKFLTENHVRPKRRSLYQT